MNEEAANEHRAVNTPHEPSQSAGNLSLHCRAGVSQNPLVSTYYMPGTRYQGMTPHGLWPGSRGLPTSEGLKVRELEAAWTPGPGSPVPPGATRCFLGSSFPFHDEVLSFS